MCEFVVGLANSAGLFGIFEDAEDTGYFYLSRHMDDGIIDHLHICDHPNALGIVEEDVEVEWSRDETKCGVKIWGRFYGIFDLSASQKIGILVKDRETTPIESVDLLSGFN